MRLIYRQNRHVTSPHMRPLYAGKPVAEKCPTRQSWEERTRQRVGRGSLSTLHHHHEWDKKKTELGQFRGRRKSRFAQPKLAISQPKRHHAL